MKTTLTVQIEDNIHRALKKNRLKIEKNLKIDVPLAAYARKIIEHEISEEAVLKLLTGK